MWKEIIQVKNRVTIVFDDEEIATLVKPAIIDLLYRGGKETNGNAIPKDSQPRNPKV